MTLANNKKWVSTHLIGWGKGNLSKPLSREYLHRLMLIIALLLVWPARHMNPHIADWVTKHGQAPSFVILSIVCDKVTEEWREVFQEFAKGGEPFWN